MTRFGQRKLSDPISVQASCAAYFKFMHSSVLDKASLEQFTMKMTVHTVEPFQGRCSVASHHCSFALFPHPHTFPSSPLRALSNIHFT